MSSQDGTPDVSSPVQSDESVDSANKAAATNVAMVSSCPCCANSYSEASQATTPFLLSCKHTICGRCIANNSVPAIVDVPPEKQVNGLSMVVAKKISCPLCKSETVVPADEELTVNRYVLSYIQEHSDGAEPAAANDANEASAQPSPPAGETPEFPSSGSTPSVTSPPPVLPAMFGMSHPEKSVLSQSLQFLPPSSGSGMEAEEVDEYGAPIRQTSFSLASSKSEDQLPTLQLHQSPQSPESPQQGGESPQDQKSDVDFEFNLPDDQSSLYECSCCSTAFDLMQAENTPFMLECGHIICAHCVMTNIKEEHSSGGTGMSVICCPCCMEETYADIGFGTDEDIARCFQETQKTRYTELIKVSFKQNGSPELIPVIPDASGCATPLHAQSQPLFNLAIPQIPLKQDTATSQPPQSLPASALGPPPPMASTVPTAVVATPAASAPATPAAAAATVASTPATPTTTTTTTTTTPAVASTPADAGAAVAAAAAAESPLSSVCSTQVSLAQLEPTLLCPDHDLPATHYCREERSMRCDICLRKCTPCSHTLVPINEALPAILEDMRQMTPNIQPSLDSLLKGELMMTSMLEDTLKKAEMTEDVILNAMSQLRSHIDELQTKLLRGLALGTFVAKKTLTQQRDAYQSATEQLVGVRDSFKLFEDGQTSRPKRLDEAISAMSRANNVFTNTRSLLAREKLFKTNPEFVLTNLKSQQLAPILKGAAELQVSLFPTPQLEIPDVLPKILTLSWTLDNPTDLREQRVDYSYEVEVRTTRQFGGAPAAPSNNSAEEPSEVFFTKNTFYVFNLIPQVQYAFRVRVVNRETHSCGYWSDSMYATAPQAMAAQQEADNRVRSVPLDLTSYSTAGIGIRAFPQALLNARQLVELNMSNNQLPGIPFGIVALEQLSKLNLHCNKLSVLPESIGLLPHLETLDLSCNELEVLPSSICRLMRLRTLSLQKNKLTELPDSIGVMTALQSLVVDYNEITRVPPSVVRLSSLEVLSLSFNKIRRIPQDFGNLHALKEFSIKSNMIGVIPDSIGSLMSLRVLDITDNRVHSLPDQLCRLPSLEILSVSTNGLAQLPECFCSLTGLTSFSASSNYLRSLPPNISTLSKLNEINVANNNISSIPRELLLLPNLRKLMLYGNPCASQYANSILATGEHVLASAPSMM